jgi:Tfp pilus assembly protein PilF
MTRTVFTVLGLIIAVLGGSGRARANPDELLPKSAAPSGSAESRFGDGQGLAERQDWTGAEEAYRDAIRLRAEFPEAWNGLGHALRRQMKYDESVTSYQEALRLKPDYPQALEYLGEAYLQVGKIAEAKTLLERLRALDPHEADELAEAIAANGK